MHSQVKVLYWYRFGTCKHVAQYLDKKDLKVVQKKLKVLEEQSLIGKRYEKAYRLQGKPAEYYLMPKGARLFMKRTDSKTRAVEKVTEQGIKSLYKNSTVSSDYVAHCLKILQVSLYLRELYGDKLQFFTRMQMIPFDYLPTWRPDGFISIKTGMKAKGIPKRYFIDIWDGTRPFFVSVRKARSYISYSEDGDWPTDEADLPAILMLCDTERNEIKLRRQIRKALEESYEELSFATSTIDNFFAKSKPWRIIDEDYDPEERESAKSLTAI